MKKLLLATCLLAFQSQIALSADWSENFEYYKQIGFYKLGVYRNVLIQGIRTLPYSNNYFEYWWNEVSNNLILGEMPLRNYNHHLILAKDKKVKYVLTIQDQFEI